MILTFEEFFRLLGWAASIYVLAAYFVCVHKKNPKIFDVANVIGSIGLVASNLYFGIGFGAFLSGAFGFIGLYGLFKGKKDGR